MTLGLGDSGGVKLILPGWISCSLPGLISCSLIDTSQLGDMQLSSDDWLSLIFSGRGRQRGHSSLKTF